VDTLVLQTRSWPRAPNPHVFMAAAALAPVRTRIMLTGGRAEPLARGAASLWAPRILYDALEAVPLSVGAARRAAVRRRPVGAMGRGDRVIAIWRGAPENVVGGSITHISGILGGFRAAGLEVSLASAVPPPPQLAEIVDDAEIVPPLRPSQRLTWDLQRLALGAALARAARRLAGRRAPRFIYQRHEAFLASGVEAATALGAPLVLEWNASELWTRTHWQERRSFHRAFDRLVEIAERRSAQGADLIAAVSTPAAEMAVDAGAPRERVLVSPNAVDLGDVDRAVAGVEPAAVPAIGWIGTFGLWHGAPILVRAFARLASPVRLVMVGDGPERAQCEAIARELGVNERIEWCGTLPHDEALRRLAACALLASPHVPLATGEPFFGSPTKLFEYMALARPIVASDLDQIGEVLTDGVTARLVEPGDEEALARALEGVLADGSLGRELGAAARREVEARHTWRARAEEILRRLPGT
jgi:glycosyltransferase involved in cell wall biosynthesis